MRIKLFLTFTVVFIVAAGGGIAFHVYGPRQGTASPAPAKLPVFVPIDTFTVNLGSSPSNAQVLQAGITLRLREKSAAVEIKDWLPEIRHRVVMVLSAQQSQELRSVAGKQKLAAQLAGEISQLIGPAGASSASAGQEGGTASPAVEVLFTSFIIQ